jgi:RNA polymerase sigma factor (TIGR02999 family)
MGHEDTVEYEERVRQLLAEVRTGDGRAFESLLAAVGHELRKLSAYRLGVQGRHTLQTSTLVKEVVLRLVRIVNERANTFPESKEHFLALATRMMKFTLADHARKRKLVTVSLEDQLSKPAAMAEIAEDPGPLHAWSSRDIETLLAVDQALDRIKRSDGEFGPRRSAVLELHLFGGMNYREIADELGITDDMARRDCRIGLSRIRELLTTEGSGGSAAARL